MTKKLISKEMLKLNTELHQRRKNYGGKGDAWADRVLEYMSESVPTDGAGSYLDYGCGKGNLLEEIRVRSRNTACFGYDPVTMPGTPAPVDFLTCNDVLEHIEPDLLDNVLEDIASKIKVRGLLVISQRLANKRLADGRNAHLIVEKTEWWVKRLAPFFREIIEVEPIKPTRRGIELAVLVKPWREEDKAFDGGPLIQLLDPARP